MDMSVSFPRNHSTRWKVISVNSLRNRFIDCRFAGSSIHLYSMPKATQTLIIYRFLVINNSWIMSRQVIDRVIQFYSFKWCQSTHSRDRREMTAIVVNEVKICGGHQTINSTESSRNVSSRLFQSLCVKATVNVISPHMKCDEKFIMARSQQL